MDDLFSLFISLGKYSRESLSVAETFKAVQAFCAKNGVSVKNQRTQTNDRIVFDLLIDSEDSITDCDIQRLSNGSESISIFGGNEHELRRAGLFDEGDVDCFVLRLALFLCFDGNYSVGLISTEDTLTSLSFKAFYPGHWTIFRGDLVPSFISNLSFEPTCDTLRVYKGDQFSKSELTPEQMGQEIRRRIHEGSSHTLAPVRCEPNSPLNVRMDNDRSD